MKPPRILLLALLPFVTVSCAIAPHVSIGINAEDGSPLRDVHVVVTSSEYVELYVPTHPDQEEPPPPPAHRYELRTDDKGICILSYRLTKHQPGLLRLLLGADLVPTQFVEVEHRDSAGRTVRTRVWIVVP